MKILFNIALLSLAFSLALWLVASAMKTLKGAPEDSRMYLCASAGFLVASFALLGNGFGVLAVVCAAIMGILFTISLKTLG